MTCAACQANVTRSVSKIDGVISVNVNLLSGTMLVEFDDAKTESQAIINGVVSAGYGAALFDNDHIVGKNSFKNEWDTRKKNSLDATKALKNRLIWSVILLIPLMYVSMGHMISLPLPYFMDNVLSSAITQLILTIPIIFINRKFYISGFKGLYRRSPNMDSLVAIGSAASLAYSIYSLYAMTYEIIGNPDIAMVSTHNTHNLYFESAAMILTLVTVGKYLESRSKNKTSSALEKLIDLAPKTATVIRNGAEQIILADDITVGDIIVIRPGDTIPVDGVITEGKGFIDQSAVTGESLPVEKTMGDSVICATQNKNGHFYFKAERVGNDTTLSQIIRLVDDASNSKAPIARIADKVSGIFVPIVILISLITAIIWLLLGSGVEFALTCAVSVLVISCPCALGLATPVAIMVGTGKAAGLGILIRSAECLENLHSIDTVVLDKTGTVTSGSPSVTDVSVFEKKISKEEFLKIAASLEKGSNHPYAFAVSTAYSGADLYAVDGFTEVTGRGITGTVQGCKWYAGNRQYMDDIGINISADILSYTSDLSTQGKTALYFAENNSIVGIIAVADTIREASIEAIKQLHKMKIHTVLLSGDNKKTAEAVCKQVGITECKAEVMPAQKESYIKELEENGHHTAMIGDGINDAPALARASVGIAIGAGTDIAVDTADIVLIKDSIFDAVNAIKLSRAVIRNIKMNLFWAFFYNIIGIPVAAGVFYGICGLQLSPMLGAAAMSLSSLFVVGNALRLRKFKGFKTEIFNIKEKKTMTKTMIIEGMMCAHCKANVEKTLLAVDGVSLVSVSLEEKKAVVTLEKDIADESLISPIETAGYKVVSCK